MVNKLFLNIMTAGMTLSVLLCGCGDENRRDVILVGSGDADTGIEVGTEGSVPPQMGMSWPTDFAQTSAPDMPENAEMSVQPAQEPPMIRVYVCGAVVCPGVVDIPQGSRIEDALRAAGGFLPDALAEAVNLADWAVDGQMLYFPTEEEAVSWTPAQNDQSGRNEQGKLVNINTAGAALLCTLPGIGEAKAADIIAYREAHGSFASCEDIMKVPGIKTNIYEKICDKITVKQ